MRQNQCSLSFFLQKQEVSLSFFPSETGSIFYQYLHIAISPKILSICQVSVLLLRTGEIYQLQLVTAAVFGMGLTV